MTALLAPSLLFVLVDERLAGEPLRTWALAAVSAGASALVAVALMRTRFSPEAEAAAASTFEWLLAAGVSLPTLLAPLLPDWVDIVAMSALVGYIVVFDVLMVFVILGKLLATRDLSDGLSEREVASIQAEQRRTGAL